MKQGNRWLSMTSLVAVVAAVNISMAQVTGEATTYRQVAWPQLPDGVKWGAMSAVAIDSKGTVYALQRENADRGDQSRVMVFDSKGTFVRSWGEKMFPLAHGLRIDRQDNVWVTDLRLHQVIKFSREGKVLLELGKRGVAGDNMSTGLLNGPSDVVIGPNGDVFVSDGESTKLFDGTRVSTRVVKYSKDGKLIKFWGTKGTGNGQFNMPHSIGMDSKGRLYVADRPNNRIEIFDQDGKYLDQMTAVGTPFGLYIANDLLYVVDGRNNDLRVFDTKDQKVLGHIEGLNTPHMVSVDATGAIYVAEHGLKGPGPAIKKFVKN